MSDERTTRRTGRWTARMVAVPILLILPLLAAQASAAPAAKGSAATSSTADVFDQYLSEWPSAPDQVDVHGMSRLVRRDNGVSMTLHTTGLTPGNVYTVWWVVVDHPELCEHPFGDYWCSPPDFGNPELGISLTQAAGHVVRSTTAHFAASLRVGDTANLMEGEGLTNPRGALISLVVRDHGPADPGMVDDQLHDMMACNTECFDVQESIHLAAPVDQWAADLARARSSTEQFQDIRKALAAGHTGEFGCVPGDLPFFAGATGIHFGDVPATIAGEVDVTKPQVLLYMPTDDFGYELVAVEWMVVDRGQEVPELFGRKFESFDTSVVPPLMDALGLEPPNTNVLFLHAWVFPEFVNFRGAFADSNPSLRCPMSPILAGGDFVFGHGSGMVGPMAGDLGGSRLHVLFEAGIVDEESGEAAGRLDACWLDADGNPLREVHGIADCLDIGGPSVNASGQVVSALGTAPGDAFALTIEDEGGDTGDLQTATSLALDVLPPGTVGPCGPATPPAVDVDHGTLTFGPAGSLPFDQLIGGDGPPGDEDGPPGP